MKKLKVTKKPKTTQEFILKPNRLRIFVIYTLLFTLAYGFGLLLRYAFSGGTLEMERLRENWVIDALIIFGGPVLLALMDYKRWVVKFQNNQLEGLSGPFGEHAVISTKEIDWTRTRRSLTSRVKIGNGIYGQMRQRILISPWFYNPADYQTFLELIGF